MYRPPPASRSKNSVHNPRCLTTPAISNYAGITSTKRITKHTCDVLYDRGNGRGYRQHPATESQTEIEPQSPQKAQTHNQPQLRSHPSMRSALLCSPLPHSPFLPPRPFRLSASAFRNGQPLVRLSAPVRRLTRAFPPPNSTHHRPKDARTAFPAKPSTKPVCAVPLYRAQQ